MSWRQDIDFNSFTSLDGLFQEAQMQGVKNLFLTQAFMNLP